MRSLRAAVVLAICGHFAGLHAAPQIGQNSETRTNPLTGNDVVGMLQAGLSQEVVIAKIKSSACDFDTSPSALLKFKSAHVPKKVILAMVEAPVVAPPPRPLNGSTRIKLDEGDLASKIVAHAQPNYPPLARQAGIQGNVLLHAIIDKDGHVGELQVISGHPLLIQSALDAVGKWRYVPFQLSGEPVEIDTTITVPFVLGNPQSSVKASANTGPGRIQNIAPEEMWNRVTQCMLPTFPEAALDSHLYGTVDIGLGISPEGEVTNTSRVLGGPPLLIQSAMDSIHQWRFRPNIVQGEATWSRVRALVHYNPDGTTSVELAPGILADSFGDPGTPSSAGKALPRPATATECKFASKTAQALVQNQEQGTPSLGSGIGPGPRFVDGAYLAGIGGVGRPICTFCPQPAYSAQAREKKISGTVVLHLIITMEGHVANVQVRRSLGYGLDEKAVEAVENWRFNPAVDAGGRPVPIWADIEVTFRLL
jgi:TonB family protein